jgi:signal transduction histidine kinase
VTFSRSTDRRQVKEAKGVASWRHDMRNQLGIVLGFADLLLQELESSDPHRTDIAEIRDAAARAMDLLRDLKLPE